MKFEKAYHIGKAFYNRKCFVIAKLIKVFCKTYFQCDIPYEADIDKDVYFCHNAFGVVINPSAKIAGGGVHVSSIMLQSVS